ncbi:MULTISPECIES: sugar ABC transporter substrate-binding protein [unclassified Roseitalea]|uniref:ABC transporter substrate-binding protein n=1 Tax=unclassified Roseitalea TaxID=2639107 RepID=UPI00273E3ACB|nr:MULTISPECIES: sugar ABC transporter substrate-binding protein [unclassified Roseitalea]
MKLTSLGGRARSTVTRRQFLRNTAAGGALATLGPHLLSQRALAQDFAGQELNVMIIQPHIAAGEMMAAAFQELTGATVNVTSVPYDAVQAQATLDVQSGANQYDVIDYWYPTLGALAEDGVLLDVTEWIERDAADIAPDDFIPSIYDVYTLHDGSRFGLPYDGDTHVLFWNQTIFDSVGVSAPTTWDEYAQVVRAVTEARGDDGAYGAAMLGFPVPIIIGSSFVNRLAGHGGAFFGADGAPAMDSEAAMMAAQAMLDVAPHVLPTPLETAFDQALPAFLSGEVAMMEFWTDLGVYAQDPGGSQIVDQWDVGAMPTGGGATEPLAALNAGFGFGVSTGSQKQDMAWEFIKFATGQAHSRDLLTTTGTGIDPTRVSNLNSDAYKAFAPKVQQAAQASMTGVLAWPTIPESPRLMERLSDELSLMLSGDQDAETAMRNTQAEWERILG